MRNSGVGLSWPASFSLARSFSLSAEMSQWNLSDIKSIRDTHSHLSRRHPSRSYFEVCPTPRGLVAFLRVVLLPQNGAGFPRPPGSQAHSPIHAGRWWAFRRAVGVGLNARPRQCGNDLQLSARPARYVEWYEARSKNISVKAAAKRCERSWWPRS